MPSKQIRFLAVTLIASSILISLASCKGGGDSIVRVGRETITEGDLETLGRVNPRLKPRLATPAGRQKVIENYVQQEMLFQESVNRGLNRNKDVRDKIALYEKILVAQALLEDELKKKVREYYDNHKDEFERVKVSQILIGATPPEEPNAAKGKKKLAKTPAAKRSEAEALKIAESVRERLTKGEEFAKVAKEVSDDDKTKANGGDLGYVTLHDKRLERRGWLPLGEKAFSMKAGEISEPIKTKDGFHIILLTEEKKLPSFEEAEAGIKFRLQADIRTALLDSLKKKYKVEYAKKEPTAPKKDTAPEGAPASPEATPAASEPSSAPESPETPPTTQ